jgi:hypothetical protein
MPSIEERKKYIKKIFYALRILIIKKKQKFFLIRSYKREKESHYYFVISILFNTISNCDAFFASGFRNNFLYKKKSFFVQK